MKTIWLVMCMLFSFAGIAGADPIGDVVPVPEPSTLLLLSTGIIGLGILARRKIKK